VFRKQIANMLRQHVYCFFTKPAIENAFLHLFSCPLGQFQFTHPAKSSKLFIIHILDDFGNNLWIVSGQPLKLGEVLVYQPPVEPL